MTETKERWREVKTLPTWDQADSYRTTVKNQNPGKSVRVVSRWGQFVVEISDD